MTDRSSGFQYAWYRLNTVSCYITGHALLRPLFVEGSTLRPKPNTFSYPYFITHTSLLFEFSIEKKYSRLAGKILEVRSTRIFPENAVETQGKYFSGGSTAFSGGLHIYYGNQIAEFWSGRKSNRRILKRSKSNRRILKRSKCRWHKLRKKEIRLLRGVWLAWQTPTGIAFLLSKKNTLGKVFGFGLSGVWDKIIK